MRRNFRDENRQEPRDTVREVAPVEEKGKDTGNLRRRIEERALALPPKQRRFAELLLNSPEEVVFGTLRSVAAWSGVSTLTVLRFAKALGFSGYHSFQRAARAAYLQQHEGREEERAVSQTSAVQATLDQQREHLDDMADRIQAEQLDAVCKAIQRAKRVVVVSTAPAYTLGELLARQLCYAGYNAHIIPATGADAAVGMRNIQPDDVVIGVHLSMIFRDVLNAIRIARSNKATTIVFGGTPVSPLAQAAHHFLYAHAEGRMFHFSLVPMLALMEVVIARLVERDPKASAEIAKTFLDLAMEERLVAAPSTQK